MDVANFLSGAASQADNATDSKTGAPPALSGGGGGATPGAVPAAEAPANAVAINMQKSARGFGIVLSDSLEVQDLTAGGIGEQAGVPIGTTITEVCGVPVASKHDLLPVVMGAADGSTMRFVFTSPARESKPEPEQGHTVSVTFT